MPSLFSFIFYFFLCVNQFDTVILSQLNSFTVEPKQVVKRQTVGSCFPLSVINGQVNYLQTNSAVLYSTGTTAVLTCNIGYFVFGNSNSICAYSIWSPPLGTCNPSNLGGLGLITNTQINAKSCLPHLAPINGQLSYSEGGLFGPFPVGTTSSLQCNSGTIASGATFSTCTSNGLWVPMMLGQCISSSNSQIALNSAFLNFNTTPGTKCIVIPLPINGQISYSTAESNGYTTGTIATLICKPGTMSTRTISTCSSSGLWNPLIGSCNPMGFTNDAVENTLPTQTAMTPSFLGIGINGHCILGLIPPLGGTIKYSQGLMMSPYPSGTIATLSCDSGKSIGESTSRCNNGYWSPPFFGGCSTSNEKIMRDDTFANTQAPDSVTSLRPKAMGSLLLTSAFPQVFGAVLPTNDFNLNTRTTNSFELPNNINNEMGNNLAMTSNSTTNIMLINSNSHCLFGIPHVLTGIITYSQGNEPYPAGTVANLQCTNGSESIGAITASCVNGLWSPMVLGPCHPILKNGIGTELQQNINPNNGMLNAVLTTSLPNNMNNISLHSPNLTLIESHKLQKCVFGVLIPLNGKISYLDENKNPLPNMSPGAIVSYENGVTAELICDSGFAVNGISKSVCKNGIFQPLIGLCVSNNIKSTITMLKMADVPLTNISDSANLTKRETQQNGCPNLALEDPQKGKIIYSTVETTTVMTTEKRPLVIHNPIGTLATLECNPGYVASGSILTMCQAQGWTMPVLGDCK